MTTTTRVPARPRRTAPDPQVPTETGKGGTPFPEKSEFSEDQAAALSAAEIRQMGCCDLIALIRVAGLPLPDECQCHLEFQDRRTLEILAFRAQRALRNQGY